MIPKLAIATATLGKTELITRCLTSWRECANQPDAHEWMERTNTPEDNLGVTSSLQWLYEHTTAPVICYLHSDVEIMEPGWDERVLREFNGPNVGIVGFGGGLQHGSEDIYKTPYRLTQLARSRYLSNVTDAESHGARFEGSREVSVLDGFALVVRRTLLDRVGGWPVARLPFHSYDYWACITAHKAGMVVRLVGIHCQHHGGATSTSPAYQDWCQRVLGKADAQVHEESHRFIYDYARGYLPWRCK